MKGRGSEVVHVQKRRHVADQLRGGTTVVDDGSPVPLRANVTGASTSATTTVDGTSKDERCEVRFYGRHWPGDLNSEIQWRGDRWRQTAEAVHYKRVTFPFWVIDIERIGERHGAARE